MAINYTPFQTSGTPLLPPNQMMSPGQYLMSENGHFRLVLQADGNLVIKEGETIVWMADIRLTAKLCSAKKCANTFISSSAIVVFSMIRPEGACGLLKALTALINSSGTTRAWSYKTMGIWSYMINAQEIYVGLGLGLLQVACQKEHSPWSTYYRTEYRLPYGSFNSPTPPRPTICGTINF